MTEVEHDLFDALTSHLNGDTDAAGFVEAILQIFHKTTQYESLRLSAQGNKDMLLHAKRMNNLSEKHNDLFTEAVSALKTVAESVSHLKRELPND